MSSKKLLAALPLAAICIIMHQHASAQEQPGMVAVRDAQTGQLRAPTAAESRALAPKPAASLTTLARPAVTTHPNGARQVHLGERGLVYSVATRASDGKISDQCVHGAQAAEQAVHEHAAHTQHGPVQHEQAKQATDNQEGRHEVR